MNAQRRQAAIEAGARALDQKRHGQDPDRETCSICREEAALMVDAAAPHLAGEPIGWGVACFEERWIEGPFTNLRAAESEVEYWRRIRPGDDARVVALVPIEVEP